MRAEGKRGADWTLAAILVSLVEAKADVQELEDSVGHEVGLFEEGQGVIILCIVDVLPKLKVWQGLSLGEVLLKTIQ